MLCSRFANFLKWQNDKIYITLCMYVYKRVYKLPDSIWQTQGVNRKRNDLVGYLIWKRTKMFFRSGRMRIGEKHHPLFSVRRIRHHLFIFGRNTPRYIKKSRWAQYSSFRHNNRDVTPVGFRPYTAAENKSRAEIFDSSRTRAAVETGIILFGAATQAGSREDGHHSVRFFFSFWLSNSWINKM